MSDTGGIRISAACHFEPAGGLGGMIETDESVLDEPFGTTGMVATDSVEDSSCKVKSRSPGMSM